MSVHDSVVLVAGAALKALGRRFMQQISGPGDHRAADTRLGRRLDDSLQVVLLKVRVQQRAFHRDTLRWLHLHHAREQVHGVRVVLEILTQFHKILVAVYGPFGERHLHLG